VPDPVTAAGPRVRRVRIATDRGPLEIAVPGAVPPAGAPAAVRPARTRDPLGGAAAAAPPPTAPMDATVVAVPVAVGATVAAGDVLVVLEAMKMEIEVRAALAGTVVAVHVTPGSPVAAGAVLATLGPLS
jgi:acetyl-CoA/propionyl-CoA carboxylase biotin carboxyl carrier protein